MPKIIVYYDIRLTEQIDVNEKLDDWPIKLSGKAAQMTTALKPATVMSFTISFPPPPRQEASEEVG